MHENSKKVKTKKEVGFVVSTQDYLVFIEGLPSARVNDIIVTKSGSRALVSAIEKEKIEGLMLDSERPKPGDYFELSEEGLRLPMGTHLMGRAINPIGKPLDGKPGLPPGGDLIDLDVVAPGIDKREKVTKQFYTGITMIDTLIPVGVGQRELMFGESRAGKSSFLLDIIINQKSENRICVYCAIGRSDIDVKKFSEQIIESGAQDYTIIIAATSSEAAPMISISPLIGCSVAEHFRNQGKSVLLILDDLSTHAKYLREMSLLAGRTPGRESYPADIFYQHSRLVERAGNFNQFEGSGNITMLPVIETDLENFTSLIPTNVMSMTDGHTLFTSALRSQGQYPAIDPDRSVTRVGRQTQTLMHKILSDKVRSLLAEYHELEKFSQFGSELTGDTQRKLKRGKVAEILIRQKERQYIKPTTQIIFLSLLFAGFYDKKEEDVIRVKKDALIEEITNNQAFAQLHETALKAKFDEFVEQTKGSMGVLEPICPTSESSKKN